MRLSKKAIVLIVFVSGILLIGRIWSVLFFSSGSDQDSNQDQLDNLSANILDQANNQDQQQPENIEGNEQQENDQQDDSGSDLQENITDNNQINDAPTTRPLRILFPPFYPDSMIQQLLTTIEADTTIKAVGNKLENRGEYDRLVTRYLSQGGGIDMIILPSIRRDDAQQWGANIDIASDTRRFFHTGFHEYLFADIDQGTIIPFGIDPILIYENTSITKPGDLSSSSRILQYIARIQSDNSTIPVAQQVTTPLTINPEEQRFDLFQESMTLGALIDYSLKNSSTDRLLMIINRTLQLPTINDILTLDRTGQQDCKQNISLCMVTDTQAGIAFGLLSATHHFSRTIINTPEIQLRDIPFGNSDSYPVLGWGIVINDTSGQKENAHQRVNSFIKLSIETQTIPYPRYLFGPTYTTIQRQAVNTKLQGLNSFKQQGNFIKGTIDAPQGYTKLGDLTQHISLQQLLDGTIDHRGYLQTIYNLLK